MEKIAIITDSCSDLKEEYRKENNIFVLPINGEKLIALAIGI